MAPPKKRLGKKHRSATTRPHQGKTPKGAKPAAGRASATSPKARREAAAKKAAALAKSRVRTQSPERERGIAVNRSEEPPTSGVRPTRKPPQREMPEATAAKGSTGRGSAPGATRSPEKAPRTREPKPQMYAAAFVDARMENALGAMLPLIEEATRPSGRIAAPLLAICGRPNVGKSTLFNRLTGTRRSIVGDEPGITRDRIYGDMEFDGRPIRLVDTGGVVPDDEALIPSEIFRQAQVALEEADSIVMVVDGRTELAAPDIELSRLLLRSGKPVFLAVNKMDTEKIATDAQNFRQLGFKEVYAISAEHALGVGELMEAVAATLPAVEPQQAAELDEVHEDEPAEAEENDGGEQPRERKLRSHGEHVSTETKVAIIGRPNVGKSTLLNALTGTGRAIVSPIAGTTRDAVDETVERNGHTFRFVDTAGIRRKGKTTMMAEKLSVIMARKHLEAADVALLLIDATEGVTGLDANIGGYAHESGRSVIVVVNKWDAVTTHRTDGKPAAGIKEYTEQVRDALKYLDYAPLLFISASEGINVEEVFKKVQLVAKERRKRITTGQMNRFLAAVDFSRAGVPYNKRLRIYYMTQAAVAPPTFVLFTDRDVKLHFSYERFLQNLIREAFRFIGSPIWFKVRARNKKGEE